MLGQNIDPNEPQTEKEVGVQFAKFANVVEAWCIYDTILISKNFYGNELNQDGWFTRFFDFGSQETHKFFKVRTEAAGLPYCNMQSSDSMDFAFMLHSVGVSVFSTGSNIEGAAKQIQEGSLGNLGYNDTAVSHWFASELPNHMAIQLKVQQDIRVELNTMLCPPGYGTVGSGTAVTGTDDGSTHGQIPFHDNAVCQGVPLLSNRYPLPTPIGIPRTASIEGTLVLSEIARDVLTNIKGPDDYQFNSTDGAAPYIFFGKRYGIQLSLIGERMVQQRGQYHR